MRKATVFVLLAWIAAAAMMATGCDKSNASVAGNETRKPVPLSDPRFNGIFLFGEGNAFKGHTFDGTSKVFTAWNSDKSVHETQSIYEEFEVDASNQRLRSRLWARDVKSNMDFDDWRQYRFSEDGKVLEIKSNGSNFWADYRKS